MIVLSPQPANKPGQLAFVELRDDHVLCANGARLIGDVEDQYHDRIFIPYTEYPLTGMASLPDLRGIVVTDAAMCTHQVFWKGYDTPNWKPA